MSSFFDDVTTDRHCTVDAFPTMIEPDASMQGTVEQQMFYNRKTLREIT
jgi:hypothetical protein